jgi:hypothetical protein
MPPTKAKALAHTLIGAIHHDAHRLFEGVAVRRVATSGVVRCTVLWRHDRAEFRYDGGAKPVQIDQTSGARE